MQADQTLHTLIMQRYTLLNSMLDDLLAICSDDDCDNKDDRIKRIIDYTNHHGIHKSPMELALLFFGVPKHVG